MADVGRTTGHGKSHPVRCTACGNLVPVQLIPRHHNECFTPSAKARKRTRKRKSR
jgi:hypothetical protein